VEALDVYRRTRRVLAEELGIEPGPALRRLEQAILRQDPSLELFDGGGRPLPPLPKALAGNLPRPASSLVGREREIGEVSARLADVRRLVTLTGPGGSGKTRLALEAAYRAASQFPDGVYGLRWRRFATRPLSSERSRGSWAREATLRGISAPDTCCYSSTTSSR
jgi:hypothetical protein